MQTTRSPSNDFRLYLQRELLRRCKERPQYSLRTFAKSLAIDPSALAKMLKGSRPIGPRMIKKLSTLLGLTPDETQDFLIPQKNSAPDSSTTETREYQRLELETFRVISDWQHYAILEMIRIDGFKPDTKWIARALRLPVAEVNAAVDRMLRLELLEITPEGQWIDRAEVATNISNPYSDTGRRKLQAQVLEKAIEALEDIPVAKRSQTSMTFAIDTDRLPEAKEIIKRFRREIAEYLSRGDKRDQVYHLSVSLYPVTTLDSKGSQ